MCLYLPPARTRTRTDMQKSQNLQPEVRSETPSAVPVFPRRQVRPKQSFLRRVTGRKI